MLSLRRMFCIVAALATSLSLIAPSWATAADTCRLTTDPNSGRWIVPQGADTNVTATFTPADQKQYVIGTWGIVQSTYDQTKHKWVNTWRLPWTVGSKGQ